MKEISSLPQPEGDPEYPFYSEEEFKKKSKKERRDIKRTGFKDPIIEAEQQLLAEDKVETQTELDPKKGHISLTPGWRQHNEGIQKGYEDTVRTDEEMTSEREDDSKDQPDDK